MQLTTQQEVDVLQEWIRQQIERGYIDTKDNGLMILESIPNGTPISFESLSAAAQAVVNRGHILFGPAKSDAQKKFDNLLTRLTQEQRETVHAWLQGQKRLVQTGDEGYLNCVAICSFLLDRRYPITSGGLDQALSNLVNNASAKLYFVPVNEGYRPGLHSDKKFESAKKDAEDRSYVGGKKNHAKNPKLVEESLSKSQIEQMWESKAEALAGKSHSQTAQIRRLLVTRPDGSPDWKATYDARCRFIDSRNGERF